MPNQPELPRVAKRNIAAMSEVEQKLLSRRPTLERVGDAVAHFFGSVWFIAAQIIVIAGWIEWNLFRRPFDPYPFPLLSLVIDVEFLLLTTFVLMNQKHQSRRNEHWAHLDLQISMLTEQEVTKNLQLLDRICKHLSCGGAADDPQVAELSKPTPLAEFVGEIEKAREVSAPANAPKLDPKPAGVDAA